MLSFLRSLGLLALLLAGAAQAQTLGDIDVRSQGDLRIVRIRFNASVGFVGVQPSGTTDRYTLRFELLAGEEPVLRQATDELRRLPAADGLPELSVAYEAAPANRIKQLTVRLAQALPLEARQGPNARSLELLLRLPEGTAAAPATPRLPAAALRAAEPAPTATPEIEAQAGALLAQAREALAARQADASVSRLNELLKLPPNGQTQTAQELIGNAWEAADDARRARIEYALYLRLYPQGEGASRVAARLTALGGPLQASAPAGAASAASAAAPPPKIFSGSIAQYYYGGKARSKSLVNIATGIDQATLSRTTESAIVTSADLSARFANGWGETRAVLRGSGSTNLQSGGKNSNSIGSAYLEQRFGEQGPAVRAGRQSPISGGLLGLFDGVSLVWPLANGLRVDVMGGVPASALVSAPSEQLFAAVLEADTLFERWGGNFYLLDQSTEGISNRRALGAELRWAGEQGSINALTDYDLVFNALNAVSLHGSLQLPQQTTVTVLVDERRAPSLQLTNALISSGVVSLKTLLQTRSLAQIKDDARKTSATARQFLVSASRPLSPRWQGSADLRYSAVGALPAVGDFEASAATGAQYSLSAQLTGTNLYSQRDVHNFNASLITTPFFNGLQLAYNNLSVLSAWPDLTLEPSIRFYTQRDKQQVTINRIGPGTRLAWKASPRASLMGELLYEVSRSRGPGTSDNSSSVFFYVGYRYELF
ncbi:exported hypothetical protein [Rubrivivax sp. A210]|uniref:hypothetical protein n=1 Tax=Rubrivivax sp. A210 TaxID=2772301 RepID=UPI0019199D09|nr:hypothetical protein [Rubrivivax sp. A210]CAD5366370.1 exported hypothetical protein [Rubrivivax sp. A210]